CGRADRVEPQVVASSPGGSARRNRVGKCLWAGELPPGGKACEFRAALAALPAARVRERRRHPRRDGRRTRFGNPRTCPLACFGRTRCAGSYTRADLEPWSVGGARGRPDRGGRAVSASPRPIDRRGRRTGCGRGPRRSELELAEP